MACTGQGTLGSHTTSKLYGLQALQKPHNIPTNYPHSTNTHYIQYAL